MEIWILTFWSFWVSPFEAGQYQSEARCIAAASYQLPLAESEMHRKLRWSCKMEKK